MDLSILWDVLAFIVMFGLLVIFHEGGHYLIARANGIKVYEFTVGIGPKIIHFKVGETEFSVRLLPFGGACIFENLDEADEEDERKENEEKLVADLESDKKNKNFNDAPVFARIATVFAGPLFNIILAFLIGLFVCFFSVEHSTVISKVMEGFPADTAGLQAGDKIISIDGEKVYLFEEISIHFFLDNPDMVEVVYERDGKKYSTQIIPTNDEEYGRIIGIVGTNESCKNLSVFKYSFYEVRFWLKMTFKGLKMLFSGKLTKDDLAGPVGMAILIDDTIESSSSYGLMNVIINLAYLSLALSINIGIMNLIPFPALDGGRLVLLFFEAITGKPVPKKAEAIITVVGFACLVLLSIFVLGNDITKIFRR